MGVLGEAAQLAALGVMPAFAWVVARGPRPLAAVALDGGDQHRRGRGRGAGPRFARGCVGGGELCGWLVFHGDAVAETIFLHLQEPWALHDRRPVAPGLRAVGVDAQ